MSTNRILALFLHIYFQVIDVIFNTIVNRQKTHCINNVIILVLSRKSPDVTKHPTTAIQPVVSVFGKG